MAVQAMPATSRRLKILDDEEIEALYGRPQFTPEERLHYFALSPPEKEALREFRSVKSQLYFIVQLGYFKAKHLFFPFALSDVEDDIRAILAQSFPNTPLED